MIEKDLKKDQIKILIDVYLQDFVKYLFYSISISDKKRLIFYHTH